MLRLFASILRPLRRPIQRRAIKMMKALRNEDDDRPVVVASSYLLEEILLPSAFRFFKTTEFRKLTKLESLDEIERGRIFNELEIGVICLMLFCLESAEALVKPEDYHFWRKVQEELPRQFHFQLLHYGVPKENADLFPKLLDMRYKEYHDLSREAWDMWDRAEPQFQKLLSDAVKHNLAGLHATAFGTTDHIRRGKLKKKDELPHLIRGWLLNLNEEIGRFILKL